MKRIVLSFLIVIYVLIAMTVTMFLFSYNEYQIAKIGNNTYYIVLKSFATYEKGDLLKMPNTNPLKAEVGDTLFYYNVHEVPIIVESAKIKKVQRSSKLESIYLLENDQYISSKYVISNSEKVKSYPIIGNILKVLTSTLGYFLFIVGPLLIMAFFEMFSISKEIKKSREAL